jgi:1,3-propanediol dehydrogenase
MSYNEFKVPLPVVFGNGAISVLGEKIRELGCRKPLVITEKALVNAGVAVKALDALKASGIECAVFDEVASDPTCAVVDAAAKLAAEFGADALIGIGGGSSMDTAKAAAIAYETGKPTREFVLAQPAMINIKIPVVLVPTTAGTGSEVTFVAVITREDVNEKWSVFTNTSLAVIDPELTYSMPKSITANTGLDALAHAAEAMTTNQTNPHSDLFGEAAIAKIFRWLPVAYNEPNNAEARTEMALAANFAGFAFNNPVTHIGHAVADALSKTFHTPHGYNCALALPEALALTAPALPETSAIIAKAMGASLTGNESGAELGTIIADAVRELMRKTGIKPLSAIAKRDDVIELAKDAADNHLSSFCPVEVTTEVAAAMLAKVYDNY